MYNMARYLSLALVVIISSLLLQRVDAQNVSSDNCTTGVHAIISRGQGAGDHLNVMLSLQSLILEQIPGSTSLGLPYDHDADNKFTAVYHGAQLLQKYVREYVASCPDAKVAVVGYSMGACLTMDAICGTSSVGFIPVSALESSYTKNVIAVIAYGDETYFPGQLWNVGNCTLGIGVDKIPQEFPRLNPRSCNPYEASLHSYCDYGDSQCENTLSLWINGGSWKLTNNLFIGCGIYPLDNNAAHHTYIEKYDQDVVDFIQSRLKEGA
ncbi:hypothetical protein N7462_011033 [Penicillium macrosclerotiorum]|uniref:uncharacterized protein n=1 Tax=Penicillium macrosclerotiorum TaxID=303699 RepID=UPI0025490426|nr:uncharacterized protein N7462_011033 [Penicillium macrosclerotiorum]KAJ5666624.1 hypothetical protein N7462_011033 [Penicillium macrosclerotiorum]